MEEEFDLIASQLNGDINTNDPNKIYDQYGDNTNITLRDKKDYVSTKVVQERFQKEDGTFDEEGFDKFYNEQLVALNGLQQRRRISNTLSNPVANTQQNRDAGFNHFFNPETANRLVNFSDPLGRKMGNVGGIKLSDPSMTYSEAAQMNKLRDAEGKIMDVTPEQFSGFLGLNAITNPMYLAKYEKDGFDENGRKVKKGDLKLDENNTPYFQLMKDGESVENKDFLSFWDVSTKEGTWINKFNFMENDDVKKTSTGRIFQAALKIGSLLYPPTRAVSGGLLLAQGLVNNISMLGKVGLDLSLGKDAEKNNFYKTLNNI